MVRGRTCPRQAEATERYKGDWADTMTANQRRPGFRLPWSSESDEPRADETAQPTADATAANADAATSAVDATTPAEHGPAAASAATGAPRPSPATNGSSATEPTSGSSATPAAAAAQAPASDAHPAATTDAPPSAAATASDLVDQTGFMRDLVAAMRNVADETRRSSITEIQTRADAEVKRLELEAERRREELKTRAEADIAGVGDWARAEAERIKAEAEQRVASRRTQLEQQLAAEKDRIESEKKQLRDRIAEYERELEAYHAQLAEINDPAAFAAAAKRMPRPPAIDAAPAAGAADQAAEPGPNATNGVAEEVHPAEEEVLAARLAALDTKLGAAPARTDAEASTAVAEAGVVTAATESAEPATTEVVVKGLGSFGAITGFRQALAGVEGIDGVALSLAQTGDFIFRATHRAGLDLGAAIVGLEGEGARVEPRPEGGLLVTLDRAR